mmetsp:Transcript_127808/g.355660  ORF Transcript_127808/g.355660 Transcript_127808/m.355660 type:complete len:271 (+) Transcript_127808:1421-2233(+)
MGDGEEEHEEAQHGEGERERGHGLHEQVHLVLEVARLHQAGEPRDAAEAQGPRQHQRVAGLEAHDDQVPGDRGDEIGEEPAAGVVPGDGARLRHEGAVRVRVGREELEQHVDDEVEVDAAAEEEERVVGHDGSGAVEDGKHRDGKRHVNEEHEAEKVPHQEPPVVGMESGHVHLAPDLSEDDQAAVLHRRLVPRWRRHPPPEAPVRHQRRGKQRLLGGHSGHLLLLLLQGDENLIVERTGVAFLVLGNPFLPHGGRLLRRHVPPAERRKG